MKLEENGPYIRGRVSLAPGMFGIPIVLDTGIQCRHQNGQPGQQRDHHETNNARAQRQLPRIIQHNSKQSPIQGKIGQEPALADQGLFRPGGIPRLQQVGLTE
mmetsp:Transcript_23216/g.35139  ORF Transcript_23216/g.35139 Transcript_23216/m.35139 type:complete len:103 (-) Transcript_23216:1422-1730(-)